eukprot:2924232-Amphidinium_carterae.1
MLYQYSSVIIYVWTVLSKNMCGGFQPLGSGCDWIKMSMQSLISVHALHCGIRTNKLPRVQIRDHSTSEDRWRKEANTYRMI